VVAEYSDDTVVDASSVTLSIDGYAVNAVVSANKATITLSLSDGNHRASLSCRIYPETPREETGLST